MFVPITNTPRPYAWGSTSAIADLLGHTPSGEPEAELWLGAHPGSPSAIVDPSIVGGARDLAEWIEAEPQLTLGRFATSGALPFLLKVLAAQSPLSLQAHPTREQAAAGYERENALGVPLDAAHRNYKDASAKPELVYALSDTFDALCGFRPLHEVHAILDELLDIDARTEDPQPQPLEDLLASLTSDDALEGVFEWLISRGPGVPTLVSLVSELAPHSANPALVTAAALADGFPDDAGIVISLLVNRVTLTRGEALYLPAGNIHAYLRGVAIELMTASDNVLRGGLTTKHVDTPELLSVLDFTPVPVSYLRATVPAAAVESDAVEARDASVASLGVEVFRPHAPDFVLVRVSSALEQTSASAEAAPVVYTLTGPGIALCTAGEFRIGGGASSIVLGRGESVYVTPDEGVLTFAGAGELFLATTGE